MTESFARLLKRRRVEAGLSQENLAELARVSTAAISALERGARRAPYKATLDLLIAALALDDDARLEIEEAAELARSRHSDSPDEVLQNNLPPQLTSFVGRENEVAEIAELLQSYRLVTVLGTGGVGKTRCAVQVARNLVGASRDGVWLAELAPISDPVLVAGVIARTLSIQEAPNRPMLDTLLGYLKRKRLLVVLDNCEHVIDEARRVVAAILRGCPEVRILATSRESLSIAGEHAYRMPSLPVPSRSTLQSLSADDLSHYAAVRLFSDRAASAANGFTLTVERATDVVHICSQLDGIPLAIELAAARVKTLSPHQLAQKLDERFRLLTGGDRSALPRHQTMRALIDWSYDLLLDNERKIFRSLSIFAGGFTLETAAAVCAEGEVDALVVLDLLSSLVDKSLVQADMARSETRYRLLESTRQYAREKLRDVGEEASVAHAHARAFLGLAEQLFEAWEVTPDRAWHARAEPELENFRAALSWAFSQHGDVFLGQRIAGELRRFWYFFGPAEGMRWVQSAQKRASENTPDAILALLDVAEAALSGVLGQYTASLSLAKRALARYDKLADSVGTSIARQIMGLAQLYLGKTAEGEALLGQALEELTSRGARKSAVVVMEYLAWARHFARDIREAKQRYEDVLAAARAVGAERVAAITSINLAEAEFQGGNAEVALRLAREGLAAHRTFGDTFHATAAAYNIVAYLVALRRYTEARVAAREALLLAMDAQFSVGLAWTLQHLAALAALRSNSDIPVIEDRRRAARVLGYVDARLNALESPRVYTEQQEYDAIIPVLRDVLGEDELLKLMAEGSRWSEDQAVADAMLI